MYTMNDTIARKVLSSFKWLSKAVTDAKSREARKAQSSRIIFVKSATRIIYGAN